MVERRKSKAPQAEGEAPKRRRKGSAKKKSPALLYGAIAGFVLLLGFMYYMLFGTSGGSKPKEPETFNGKLFYHVSFDTEDEKVKKISKIIMARVPDVMEFTFWGKSFRSKIMKKNKVSNDFVVKEGVGYLLKHKEKEVYKVTSEELKEGTKTSTPTAKMVEETKEVFGYICQKYEVEKPPNNISKMILWATDQINIKLPEGSDKFLEKQAEFFTIKGVKGTPLKVEMVLEIPQTKGATLSFTVEQLELVVSEEDLEIPSHFKEKDYSVLQIGVNEIKVIGQLRSLSTSQNQAQNAAIVDTDLDTIGEYAWLQELAGTAACRGSNKVSEDSFIRKELGETAKINKGIGKYSGYFFMMYLPSKAGVALREPADLSKEKAAPSGEGDSNPQETRWMCYAWPAKKGKTGNRSFVVNQAGEVLASSNADYNGLDKIPTAEACFLKGDNQEAAQNLEGELALKADSFSGFTWEPVN